MLTVPLVIAVLLGSDPSAASSTPAPPTPLREIGRVRGRTVCESIVVHANAGIDSTLDNDRTLAIAVSRLSSPDLDAANVIQRRRALDDLMALASKLREQGGAGEGEVKRLRAMAESASDPERKTELKAFADALGGALHRQRLAAVALQRAIVIMDGRREVGETHASLDDASAPAGDARIPGRNGANVAGPIALARATPPPPSETAALREIADEMNARSALILADEGTAADHALGATTGC